VTVDLFGTQRTPAIAQVRLYADEVQPYVNPIGERWMYVGTLAIPEDKHGDALAALQAAREATEYDGEVHFARLTNYSYAKEHSEKTLLARKWMELVLCDAEKVFHFYVLGLNLSNLTPQAFGRRGRRQPSIYNRFFRSALLYVVKAYFGTPVVVTAVFHDKGAMECDRFFDWHSICRIEGHEPGITFAQDRIEFIDSDHRSEPVHPSESHFIQLIDVILGATTQCLDCTSGQDGCSEVAQALLPLIERLTDRKRVSNPKSKYAYVGRCSVAFFPSQALKPAELEDPFKRAQSHFYIHRRLLLSEKMSGQLPLC
jgi:hypothetical protein